MVGAIAQSDGKQFELGDLVYLNPVLPCGSCLNCQRGRTNVCADKEIIEGGLADFAVIPERALRRVPEGLDPVVASLLEPLATAVHAVDVAFIPDRAGAAVIGFGSIGQLLLHALSIHSLSQLVVIDPVHHKRELATSRGATTVLPPEALVGEDGHADLSDSIDVVFDCVGNEATGALSLELVAPGGTVVVVGGDGGSLSVPLQGLLTEALTIVGAYQYVDGDFERAEQLGLESPDLARIVTATFELAEADRAFEAAASGAEGKVQVVPKGDDGLG
jgi:L-iditol 2-dehydrogenase